MVSEFESRQLPGQPPSPSRSAPPRSGQRGCRDNHRRIYRTKPERSQKGNLPNVRNKASNPDCRTFLDGAPEDWQPGSEAGDELTTTRAECNVEATPHATEHAIASKITVNYPGGPRAWIALAPMITRTSIRRLFENCKVSISEVAWGK